MLGEAIGRLLPMPPTISLRHIAVAARDASPSASRTCAGCCAAGAFSFEEAVRGADRMTVAVTLFALLELYKRGEADWEQGESFGEIAVRAPRAGRRGAAPVALAGAAPPSRAGGDERRGRRRSRARAHGRGAAVPLAPTR